MKSYLELEMEVWQHPMLGWAALVSGQHSAALAPMAKEATRFEAILDAERLTRRRMEGLDS